MKDAGGHGSEAHGGLTTWAQERVALNKRVDAQHFPVRSAADFASMSGKPAHQTGVEAARDIPRAALAPSREALPRIIRNADDDTLLDISRWERQTERDAMLAHGKTQRDENQDGGSLDPNRPAKAARK